MTKPSKDLRTGYHGCERRMVTMKRHFRRHLQRGDAVTRPSEEPADGVLRLRVPEGDDETPLSSAPSAGGCDDKAVRRTCRRGPTAAGAGM